MRTLAAQRGSTAPSAGQYTSFLNAYALDGWELVQVVRDEVAAAAVLLREARETFARLEAAPYLARVGAVGAGSLRSPAESGT